MEDSKIIQTIINQKVLDKIEEYNDKNQDIVSNKRLYYCSARIYYTDDYILLQSYRTITALYDKKTGELFDFLRYVYGYTSTSAHHYGKFRNYLRENKHDVTEEYRYYHT